jgi:hypothetical protein
MKALFFYLLAFFSIEPIFATVWITDTRRGRLYVLQRPNEPENGYLCCHHFALNEHQACADDCPVARVGIENGNDFIGVKKDGTLTIDGEETTLKLNKDYISTLSDNSGNINLEYHNTNEAVSLFESEKNNPIYWAKSDWHLIGDQFHIEGEHIGSIVEGTDLTGLIVYTVIKKEFVDSDLQIQITPNPVSNFTFINYKTKKTGKYEIEIHSLNGKTMQVLSENITKKGLYRKRIDTSNFPSGMYLVSMKLNNSSIKGQTIKFIKN